MSVRFKLHWFSVCLNALRLLTERRLIENHLGFALQRVEPVTRDERKMIATSIRLALRNLVAAWRHRFVRFWDL